MTSFSVYVEKISLLSTIKVTQKSCLILAVVEISEGWQTSAMENKKATVSQQTPFLLYTHVFADPPNLPLKFYLNSSCLNLYLNLTTNSFELIWSGCLFLVLILYKKAYSFAHFIRILAGRPGVDRRAEAQPE